MFNGPSIKPSNFAHAQLTILQHAQIYSCAGCGHREDHYLARRYEVKMNWFKEKPAGHPVFTTKTMIFL